MKILVLTPSNPLTQKGGLEIRVWNIWKRLAKYYDVTIITYDLTKTITTIKSKTQGGVNYYILPLKIPKTKYLRWLWYGISPNLIEFNSKNILKFCEGLINHNRFDLIVADHLWLAPTVVKLKKLSSIKTLYLSHGFEYIFQQRWEKHANIFTRFALKILLRNLEMTERKLLTSFSYLTCISHQEKKLLIEWEVNKNKIEIIPNGIDLSSIPNTVVSNPGKNFFNLFFVGSLDYVANKDALKFFIAGIYSPLRQDNAMMKNVKLIIVSRYYPAWLKKFQKDDSSIMIDTGSCSIQTYLSMNTVCIAPVRIGCGSRVKVLEYFKYQQPVIATKVGAEGIDCEHLKNIIITDDPVEFRNWVIKLINNKNLRKKLGENARKLVEKKYSWDKIAEKLNRFISQTIK